MRIPGAVCLLLLASSAGSADAFLKPALSTPFLKAAPSTKLFGSNVVLSPSENANAFDSLKIGGARVHRYARDDDPAAQTTEYVMWYHGRSIEQDKDKSLPPLSTGRIGRATSRNGLSWKKDETGSLSEDASDCSLGLNKESWWGFDTAHVGLGNVLLPLSTPAVVSEGGVYLMYFMGGNFEDTPVADYVDKDVPADATLKGMRMRIGVAVSQDGVTWGRIEGDDPTGACMVPYLKDDPNAKEVAASFDGEGSQKQLIEELYCAWPDVVVNQSTENNKGGFLMYYSTMTKDSKTKSIACALSSDGFRWFKRGLCVEPEEGTLDSDGCARCNVIRKATFSDADGWVDADGYTMYYEGVSKDDGKHRILTAESADGRVWAKTGVALDVGGSGDDWDHEGVGSPHIVRLDDGSLRMYYTGQGANGSTAVGVAKLTQESSVWEREQATITFADVDS